MLGSLNAGISGLQQFQLKLDVIGNNIANSNTLGYKSARAEFEDTFAQTLQTGGVSPMQVGSGVATASIRSRQGTGTISSTGVQSNLAIDGDGFFSVIDPVSGKSFVTRAGDFHTDNEGYLITNNGYRVQGFSSGTTRGEIRIDDNGKPQDATGSFDSYKINPKGEITVKLTSGESFVRGQVLLQRFINPDALTKEGSNLFTGMADAGALGQTEAPDSNGLGSLKAGSLEMSNVDLADEFAMLIMSQRGFQASARIITTSDEILQEVVNLKR